MWHIAELGCILLGLNLANALLLDQSCYNAKYQITKGGNTINLIEQAFENVRKNLVGMVADLKKPFPSEKDLKTLALKTVTGSATSMSPHFALHFMNLFQGEGSTKLDHAGLKVVKRDGTAGAEALLRHFGQVARFPNSDPDKPWPANIADTETIVYCDVSRFAGKLDVATKEYKHAINGEEDLLDEDFYDDCIEDPQIMDFETKAFTAGRSAAAAAMWPNLRNNMQLCPQWLRVLLAKGGINNFEQKRYYGQLAIQNQLLPDYPWPQVKPVTPQKKGLRGNPQEHISMHDGIWLEHTLFHELTHTGWWEAQVPTSPGGTAGAHIEPLDDLPGAKSAQTSPGGTVTPALRLRAYGWDNAVEWHVAQNANNWAYLLDGWFVMNKLPVPMAIDTLGELILEKFIKKVDPKTKKILTAKERIEAFTASKQNTGQSGGSQAKPIINPRGLRQRNIFGWQY
ncbi:hypothetical protein GLAREA_12760 [Glarea lozoyensis ATCC 20868]|uniref:Lysine-specific metallo-endopeptidase domain-containing protein n=1 Tax=Glarea lozoyensis (strain ATCC 20868 / MF5171) TaxID=1116229 RepID=S3CYV6_GLAL2|nr:uncharacterized protein GLAREA_12760 [Glarea lozoyensis ATCC 20868]EPE31457.1 hypothetical protein GLAREA_12760 [Glarea lozoyensis ATCC 20868]